MDACLRNWIIGFLIASAVFTVAALIYIIFKRKNRRKPKSVLVFILILLAAVWCARYPVGLYRAYYTPPAITSPEENNADEKEENETCFEKNELNCKEEIVNSFIHALQTFSMDEDYTTYLLDGKQMVSDLRADDNDEKWVGLYSGYTSTLNLVAPILGGAIILEVIANFFPSFILCFTNLFGWLKKRYFFNELNERSVALMHSIYSNARFKRLSAFVFANVGEDADPDLLQDAKTVGAICVGYDIDRSIGRFGFKRTILLMNNDENKNLQSLTAVLEANDGKKIPKTEIYVFSTDKKFSHIEEEVSYIVKQRVGKFKTDEEAKAALPLVVPVDATKNMVYTLLRDVPLYEPLVDSEEKEEKTLNLTIFGSGTIGTQMFLNSYWCGQMLNCKLRINVVSKEKRSVDCKNADHNCDCKGRKDTSFEGRINYINPDIFKTADPDSELLIYNSKGDRNEPYFDYDYICADVLDDDFENVMTASRKDGFKLVDSDYFVVALGTDEDNFAVADRIRQSVGKHQVYDETGKRAVISYVIYNSELCRALNIEPKHYYTKKKEDGPADIYMWAFGCMDDVYSEKNVFFSEVLELALSTGDTYNKATKTEATSKTQGSKLKRIKDVYGYKSDIARSYHYGYKAFSAGKYSKSVFSAASREKYFESVSEMRKEYHDYAVSSTDPALAWLEHRRWNAYLRSNGFRHGEYEPYYAKENTHKNLGLKIHPCIVETDKTKSINARFDERGIIITETEFLNFTPHDLLDELSLEINNRNGGGDFKRWDYPRYALNDAEVKETLYQKCKTPKFENRNDLLYGVHPEKIYLIEKKWYIAAACLKEIILSKLAISKDSSAAKQVEKIVLSMSIKNYDVNFVAIDDVAKIQTELKQITKQ